MVTWWSCWKCIKVRSMTTAGDSWQLNTAIKLKLDISTWLTLAVRWWPTAGGPLNRHVGVNTRQRLARPRPSLFEIITLRGKEAGVQSVQGLVAQKNKRKKKWFTSGGGGNLRADVSHAQRSSVSARRRTEAGAEEIKPQAGCTWANTWF